MGVVGLGLGWAGLGRGRESYLSRICLYSNAHIDNQTRLPVGIVSLDGEGQGGIGHPYSFFLSPCVERLRLVQLTIVVFSPLSTAAADRI